MPEVMQILDDDEKYRINKIRKEHSDDYKLKKMGLFANERAIFKKNGWIDSDFFKDFIHDRLPINERIKIQARRYQWTPKQARVALHAAVRRWYIRNKWVKEPEKSWQKKKIDVWSACNFYRGRWKLEHKDESITPKPPSLTSAKIAEHERLLHKSWTKNTKDRANGIDRSDFQHRRDDFVKRYK